MTSQSGISYIDAPSEKTYGRRIAEFLSAVSDLCRGEYFRRQQYDLFSPNFGNVSTNGTIQTT